LPGQPGGLIGKITGAANTFTPANIVKALATGIDWQRIGVLIFGVLILVVGIVGLIIFEPASQIGRETGAGIAEGLKQAPSKEA
jgi:hypothetical protein